MLRLLKKNPKQYSITKMRINTYKTFFSRSKAYLTVALTIYNKLYKIINLTTQFQLGFFFSPNPILKKVYLLKKIIIIIIIKSMLILHNSSIIQDIALKRLFLNTSNLESLKEFLNSESCVPIISLSKFNIQRTIANLTTK